MDRNNIEKMIRLNLEYFHLLCKIKCLLRDALAKREEIEKFEKTEG